MKTNSKLKAKNKNVYSHMVGSTAKRRSFMTLLVVYFFIFAGILYADIMADTPWQVIAGPLAILGLLLVFFPSTEEWVYHPWQSTAQQYERHFYEKR